MTTEEIKALAPESKSDAGWLQEIAYQLAVMNEQPQQEPQAEPELCFCGKKKGHVGRHIEK